MRVLAALLGLLLFLMAGCELGPTHFWYHPARTLEQARADCELCEERARADEDAAKERTDKTAPEVERGVHYIFEGCMEGKGYLKLRDYRLPSNVRKKNYSLGGVAGR